MAAKRQRRNTCVQGSTYVPATHAALVQLLIRKGLFTELEYVETLADLAEAEQAAYEARLQARTGAKVTLG